MRSFCGVFTLRYKTIIIDIYHMTDCESRVNQNYTRKTQHDGFWLGKRSVGGKIDASSHQTDLRYAPVSVEKAPVPDIPTPDVEYIFLVAELE